MKYQKEIKNDLYDVIVIGSGMAGLVTAANIVSEGLSVLVLEQHFIPGGATTMFKRKDFLFEAGGHRFSGIRNPEGVLAKLMKKINKTIKVEPINPSYVVRSGDKILKADLDINKYKQNVIDLFPAEKQNIERYFAAMLKIAEGNRYLASQKKINPVILLFKHSCFFKNIKKNTRQFMEQFFKDEEIIFFLTMLGAYTTLPIHKQSFIGYANLWACHHTGEGMSLIKGGTKQVVDALVEYIDENGGQVVVSKYVEKILTENKKAIGVRVKDGTEIKSKVIVSTASNKETYLRLLDENLSGKKFINNINNQKQSGSLFQLFLGIKEENGEGLEYTTTFVAGDSKLTDAKVYKKMYDWDLETITSGGVITVEGKENSPQGFRSVNISCLIPYHHPENWFVKEDDKKEYREFKEKIAKQVIENFSKYIPNLKDRIVCQNTATPLTIERYTLATEGGLQGLAHTINQSGKARGNIKTHIENLYHAGQYNFPGAGIITVSVSGNLCSEMILKEHFTE
ncbi:MAG: NAD(P)/FAD-dependent oxidoreductase [Bacteroidales bacterium]|nr:NAD(P)/FAD-dependent oxidoreductase [Bacteroidales bacterium]